MIIAITGLKPFNLLKKIHFLSLSAPLMRKALSSKGNLHGHSFQNNGYYHTITAWESRDAMMGYVYSPAHQKAIDLYDVLGEGLTCHYESKEIPSVSQALKYWKVNGR